MFNDVYLIIITNLQIHSNAITINYTFPYYPASELQSGNFNDNWLPSEDDYKFQNDVMINNKNFPSEFYIYCNGTYKRY